MCGIFRAGKLCRRCLGINDATPGALIDKAMDLMGETLVSEVSHTIISRLLFCSQLKIMLFYYVNRYGDLVDLSFVI